MALDGSFFELNTSPKETGIRTSLVKTDELRKYDASLSSYESACQEDPELKSFDSSLHELTSKLIRSVYGGGGKTGNIRLDALIEICGFLVRVSQDVVNIIVDNIFDLSSKNEELESLVDLYFEITTKTLNLFNTIKKRAGKAAIIQLLIRVAIKLFETESMNTDLGGDENKYEKTLEKLNEVQAMEDPFGEEFVKQFEDVHKEQVMLLAQFREMQVMLEKKHKSVKKWRRLGNTLFAASLFSVFAISIVCTVASLPVVGTVAAVAAKVAGPAAAKVVVMTVAPPAVGLTTTGILYNKLLASHEEAIKKQNDLFKLMENSTKDNTRSMVTIKGVVDTLITSISSIQETVERGKEEESVKVVMQDLIKNVEEFTEDIDQVRATVAKCSKVVSSGRVRVLDHLANPVSLKGK